MVKKEQVIIVTLLLGLSGCGWRQTKQENPHYGYMHDDVLSELDIDDASEVRSFFDDDQEDIFSESEFVGWAEKQEVLDLDEFYNLKSTSASAQEPDVDSSDEVVVAFEDSLADSLDNCVDGVREEIRTALDVEYETYCSVDSDDQENPDNVKSNIDIPEPEKEVVDLQEKQDSIGE